MRSRSRHARSQVGVCPQVALSLRPCVSASVLTRLPGAQHDILFDKLTAREHLLLFGKLKRVNASSIASSCVSIIGDAARAQVAGDLNAAVVGMLDEV